MPLCQQPLRILFCSGVLTREAFVFAKAWPRGVQVFHIGDWTLAIASILTLFSGLQYLHAAWPSLREDERLARETARAKKNA